MKVRFSFDGKCPWHPRYHPDKGEQPAKGCERCDDLYVIWLYVARIATTRARNFPGFEDRNRPQPKKVKETAKAA